MLKIARICCSIRACASYGLESTSKKNYALTETLVDPFGAEVEPEVALDCANG
jgi:hypothetical protein